MFPTFSVLPHECVAKGWDHRVRLGQGWDHREVGTQSSDESQDGLKKLRTGGGRKNAVFLSWRPRHPYICYAFKMPRTDAGGSSELYGNRLCRVVASSPCRRTRLDWQCEASTHLVVDTDFTRH